MRATARDTYSGYSLRGGRHIAHSFFSHAHKEAPVNDPALTREIFMQKKNAP